MDPMSSSRSMSPAAALLRRLDCSTPDVAATSTALRSLLGWQLGAVDAATGAHVLVDGAAVVATVVPQPPEVVAVGAPARWTPAFAVPSLADAVAAVPDGGGRVAVAGFEVPGGTMAVVVDPAGVPWGLVEPAGSPPVPFRAPAGVVRCTHQVDEVLIFATAVLDWSARPAAGGHEWRIDGALDPVALLVPATMAVDAAAGVHRTTGGRAGGTAATLEWWAPAVAHVRVAPADGWAAAGTLRGGGTVLLGPAATPLVVP